MLHDIASLLGSDFAPTAEQASQLRQSLARSEARLGKLESELALTLTLVERLRRERDETQHDIDTHLAVLSPIRRMPLCVMQEIFHQCLTSDRYIRPASMKAPLLLAQVCSSWRNLALSTPMLWSSLFVVVNSRNVAERTELTRLWFERSSQCAMNISVYAPSIVGFQLKPILDLLSANFHRFRHLTLVMPSSHLSVASGCLAKGAPLLETLDVTFNKVDNDILGIPVCSLRITPDSAPRLRSLSWNTRNHVAQSYFFDTMNIVDLNIDQMSLTADQCLQLLGKCPSLNKAQFRVISTPILQSQESRHVVHHRLNSLAIHSKVAVGSLFDHLTLPNLQTLIVAEAGLDLENSTMSVVWQPSSFAEFVERSQCSISTLRFSNALESENALISCLQSTNHSLSLLQLSDIRGIATPITDRVLRLLTVRETADGHLTCLCPKLETIKFGTCLSSTDGVLAEMIESRWIAHWQGKLHGKPVIARLKSMNPRLDPARNSKDVAMLIRLRDAGLEIV